MRRVLLLVVVLAPVAAVACSSFSGGGGGDDAGPASSADSAVAADQSTADVQPPSQDAALADPFFDDFEKGSCNGWQASGQGIARITDGGQDGGYACEFCQFAEGDTIKKEYAVDVGAASYEIFGAVTLTPDSGVNKIYTNIRGQNASGVPSGFGVRERVPVVGAWLPFQANTDNLASDVTTVIAFIGAYGIGCVRIDDIAVTRR